MHDIHRVFEVLGVIFVVILVLIGIGFAVGAIRAEKTKGKK